MTDLDLAGTAFDALRANFRGQLLEPGSREYGFRQYQPISHHYHQVCIEGFELGNGLGRLEIKGL